MGSARTDDGGPRAGRLAQSGWGICWDGAAGAYALIDPENQLAVFYIQHMLNGKHPYIHPRLRNIVYQCLS